MSATLERVETRGERERILLALSDRTEELVDAAVATMQAEIPAYAAAGDGLLEDVRHQIRLHHETKLRCLLADEDVTLEDLAFTRGAAMRRARAGLALEDYINAFRIGQQVFWDMVLECASETAAGREAALTLATPLMRYCDVAQTQAGRAFGDYLGHTDERRELLEHLLAGELPAHAAAVRDHRRRRAAGRRRRARQRRARPRRARHHAHAGRRRRHRGGRRRRPSARAATPAGSASASARSMSASANRWRSRSRPSPRAWPSSRAPTPRPARRWSGWARRAGSRRCRCSRPSAISPPARPTTARRLIDPALRAFLAEDRARGGVVRDTLHALAEADLTINVAAERLQIHPNTAKYRLSRIEERTGRNPRHVGDLFELLTAIALQRSSSERLQLPRRAVPRARSGRSRRAGSCGRRRRGARDRWPARCRSGPCALQQPCRNRQPARRPAHELVHEELAVVEAGVAVAVGVGVDRLGGAVVGLAVAPGGAQDAGDDVRDQLRAEDRRGDRRLVEEPRHSRSIVAAGSTGARRRWPRSP